ncbi:MAG: ABC transporter ATP-binding protein [Thermoplasmata archaeon]|nr:ABC transporter ATP-binding protein [Thermoplasmata archaeon]
MTSDRLLLDRLGAEYDGQPVLRDVSLSVAEGEIGVLMGPNGSGKTTLLRCIAGLESPSAGSVRIDGRDLDGVPTHERGIGYVSQEPSLFPHRTVEENVAYGPEVRRWETSRIDARLELLFQQFRLTALRHRFPEQLSGGERQRVALARAIAPEPKLLLLDEPLGSVDPELRSTLRAEMRSAFRALRVTTVVVTHDRQEGLFFADRVHLLLAGRLVQSGPPLDVYRSPRTPDVARFLGYNVVLRDGRTHAIAPEDVEIVGADRGLPASLVSEGIVGRHRALFLTTERGERVEAHLPPEAPVPSDRIVYFDWKRSVGLGAPAPDPA